MNRNEMIDALRKGYCMVKFTKVNGEEREMECTLNMEYIPESLTPKGGDTQPNDDVIRVFDVRAAGWRSFRVGNVLSFEV